MKQPRSWRGAAIAAALALTFCTIVVSPCLARISDGGAFGLGFISEREVEGDEIGGSPVPMFHAMLHGDHLGTSLEGAFLLGYNYEMAGRDVSASARFLQARGHVGHRFTTERGYLFPYVAGGVGFFVLTGTVKSPPTFDSKIEETGLLYSFGAGLYLTHGGRGLYLDVSHLTGDYPPGKGSHILVQLGLLFVR